MILLIDNYDSFTYNLYQYLCELGEEVRVARNDKITIAQIERLKPDHIVISPGPGAPKDAGVSNAAIRTFAGRVPILGVCLGHQCIGEVYGATVAGAGEIVHGKTSQVMHDGKGLFKGLPNPFEAIRYHSLAIQPETVPDCLEVTAKSDSGVIMGVRHKGLLIEGVQFHPESILTTVGKDLLRNFLAMGKGAPRPQTVKVSAQAERPKAKAASA
ncbi:MAG: aminodeoxychorismate/anthranilate synthase component II [Chloroflexi bacterium]|nr:aminodeoxychorismate/anthranilate synthase component II [Chloroflexota bacterium]